MNLITTGCHQQPIVVILCLLKLEPTGFLNCVREVRSTVKQINFVEAIRTAMYHDRNMQRTFHAILLLAILNRGR